MITFFVLWSIIATFIIFYLIFEPRFELNLIQYDEYNRYVLHFCYIIKSDPDDVKYREIVLFSFKIKRKEQ